MKLLSVVALASFFFFFWHNPYGFYCAILQNTMIFRNTFHYCRINCIILLVKISLCPLALEPLHRNILTEILVINTFKALAFHYYWVWLPSHPVGCSLICLNYGFFVYFPLFQLRVHLAASRFSHLESTYISRVYVVNIFRTLCLEQYGLASWFLIKMTGKLLHQCSYE